jgi:hypothetical protein
MGMVLRGWIWGAVCLSAAVAVAEAPRPRSLERAGQPASSTPAQAARAWSAADHGARALASADDVPSRRGKGGPVVTPEPRDPSEHAAAALAAARALFASLAREAPAASDAGHARDPARLAPRASSLGLPRAPADPAPRTRFAIPRADPASAAARSIARRVPRFFNFRAQVPGAVWREDEAARFAIRSQKSCLAELARLGVAAHLVSRPLATPVAVPVAIEGPIDGVAFASLHADREVEVSCELAVRLPALARILRAQGVLAVGVNSSYRSQPKVSFHTFGLALDVAAFRTRDRTLLVAKHFEVTPDARTCDVRPAAQEAGALLAIACAVAESGLFSSVLTPNYNEGHRDHFHFDLRPDDPRLFVR